MSQSVSVIHAYRFLKPTSTYPWPLRALKIYLHWFIVRKNIWFVGYFRTRLGSLGCWRMLRHAGSRGCWDQTNNQFKCTCVPSRAAVETLEVKHQSDSEAWCSSVWFRIPQSEGELKLHLVFFYFFQRIYCLYWRNPLKCLISMYSHWQLRNCKK